MTRSRPTSAFRSDDLPTFGRPRIATLIASSPTGRSPCPGRRLDDLVQEVAGAVAVERRDGDRVAEAETVELERLEVAARVVELVREHENRPPRHAQDLGELLVAGRHAGLRIDDEEHEVGLLDRLTRLRRDLRAERPGVRAVDAARVDEAERRSRPLAEKLLAVARDSRRLVHDRGARRSQAVDQRRLADVREADDRDRAGDLDVGDYVGHDGGVASRGRPSSWTPASHSQSLLISRSISTDASLYPLPPRGRPSKVSGLAPRDRDRLEAPETPLVGAVDRRADHRHVLVDRDHRRSGLHGTRDTRSADASPRRRARAHGRSRTISRIVRTASRSDSPRRTENAPNERMSCPRPGTRCASTFAMK